MKFTTRIEQYDFLRTLGYHQDNGLWRDRWCKTLLDQDEKLDWEWTTPDEFLFLVFDRIYKRGYEKGQAELRNDVKLLAAKIGLK